ncbi:MAG: AAA family ATPase, partial [Candidatus Poseidoniales archaeon]
KTTILNALSYALFGSALTNIRKDNLINKTNGKNMLVSLEFAVNGQEYRVERGRKPNLLKFFVNNEEQEAEDTAQGDSRQTQAEIERILGLSHDMFKHVLALNTYTEPFLSMRSNDQRAIIEELLGITLLSERAESIKEQMKQSKDAQKEEELRIKAVQEANKRIEDQIVSLEKRRSLWERKKTEDVEGLTTAIDSLSHVDIDEEIAAHRALDAFYDTKKAIEDTNKWIRNVEQDNAKLGKLQTKLEKEIADLESHKCYACGQELHDNKHEEILASKRDTLEETAQQILANQTQEQEYRDALAELGELGTAPTVFYDTVEQAYEHQNTLSGLQRDLETRSAETDPYTEQIEEMKQQALQEVNYNSINELTRLQEHQDFLYKLLTNKDSFVRKRIIDQN